MTPLGVGNDGLGSVRWPAQCCGITALKPTLGRIPRATSIEPADEPIGAQLMIVQGPMARRVADLRAAFAVMAGPTWRDPWSVPAPLRGPQIAAETTAAKAEPRLSVGTVLRSRIVRRALVRVMQRQPVNVTSAEVPGPPFGVYLAGARLLAVFPVLPLAANVSLGVGAMSYAGQFNILAIADQGAYPDFDVFAASAEDKLRALAASA